jgi:hypothetical protein
MTQPQAGYAPPPQQHADAAVPVMPAHGMANSGHESMYGGSSKPEDVDVSAYLDFNNRMVRHGFIRKVYGILMTQLAFTFGVTFLFVYNERVKNYVYQNAWMLYLAISVQVVTIIALACFRDMRRRYPTNYILLASFTGAEAYLVGVISSTYDTTVVLQAFISAFVVVLSLTIFAWQTKYDFTMMGGALWGGLWALIMMGFLRWFFPADSFLNTVYASLGVIIFSLYVVYDTQLIVGKGKYKISPDEYVFGALMLYLDVVNLFLFLLRLFGGGGGGRRR